MSSQKLARHSITALRAALLVIGIVLLLIFVPKSASGANDIEAVGGKPAHSIFSVASLHELLGMSSSAEQKSTVRVVADTPKPQGVTPPTSSEAAKTNPAQPQTPPTPDNTPPSTPVATVPDHAAPHLKKAADTLAQKTANTPAAERTHTVMDKLLALPQMAF